MLLIPDTAKTTYRAFVLGHDGHIKDSEIVEAENDASAIRAAAEIAAKTGTVELWEGSRLVSRIEGFFRSHRS